MGLNLKFPVNHLNFVQITILGFCMIHLQGFHINDMDFVIIHSDFMTYSVRNTTTKQGN